MKKIINHFDCNKLLLEIKLTKDLQILYEKKWNWSGDTIYMALYSLIERELNLNKMIDEGCTYSSLDLYKFVDYSLLRIKTCYKYEKMMGRI